ncbi:hypothetical protein EB796_003775 [Bugula neritina]|uniref:Uncharacterized protein n=1 Tax=Bugula neritina TaxID=10212 RepID=A0A7J7KKP2_BUGNE|nr:hypothetical protein EB796_003775 [Bugula neritina]
MTITMYITQGILSQKLTRENMTKSVTAGSCCTGVLIVGSLLSYILCVALNAVLNIPGISPFNTTIGNLSHKYSTGITPSNATFGIWGLIYFWQLVLVVYVSTLLCRKAGNKPLYISPGFIPASFLLSYIVNLLGNPAWIYVFLLEDNVKALGLLLLGVVTLVICLMSSCSQLEQSGAEMEMKGLLGDIWCTRIIVQNAWVSCATAINTVVVLTYILGVSMSSACFGALAVINVIIVGWFILETFLYDRQLRYVFAHYISYIIAFVGVYKAQYDPSIPYTIYEVVLLAIVSALALAKLIIMIVRAVKDPIHYSKLSDGISSKEVPFMKVMQVHY